MRILYVACGFDGGRSGISVYIHETLTRLAIRHELTVVTSAADRPLLPNLPTARYHVLPRLFDRPILNMLYVWLLLPLCFRPKRFDFLLLPAANRRAPGWRRFFTVAVVHDLSQYHIEAKYDPLRMFYIKHILPRAVRKADRVVAISGSTARDLEEFWRIDPARITINFDGYDDRAFTPVAVPGEAERIREKYRLERPFILYISRIEHPGKNHLRLIQAYETLPPELRDRFDLVLGGSAWSGSEAVYAYRDRSPCREQIKFIGFVPSEELPAFYRLAALYICPSLFEGFGLSVPEAMACGTVVACSDNSSLGEIAGDAAVLFAPDRVPAIAEAMRRTLADDALRAGLRMRGFERVKLFSWDRHAKILLEEGERKFAPRNRLLGITYDNVDMAQALAGIGEAVETGTPQKIAFVNADCFNQGFTNAAYREMLRKFDRVFPDGSGVALAGKLLKKPVKDNVNGTDLFPLLAQMAQERAFTLYLCGARPGVAARMRDNLLNRWPDLRIVGVRDGFSMESAAAAIGKVAPDILLVALGVPRQEEFILNNFAQFNCRVAIGVGGLFDFYSGNMPRAPKWLRKIGMEWSFRLLMEPRRMFRRYILGNPRFLIRTVLYREGGDR